MSEVKEKQAWKERSDQAMEELFPSVYANPRLAMRLFQRLVDEPIQARREFIADEIKRLKLVEARQEDAREPGAEG